MADRITNPLAGTNGRRRVLCSFALVSPGADGDCEILEGGDFVESAAYTAEGELTLVMKDQWTGIAGAYFGAQEASPSGAYAEIASADVKGTRTVVLSTGSVTGGTAAEYTPAVYTPEVFDPGTLPSGGPPLDDPGTLPSLTPSDYTPAAFTPAVPGTFVPTYLAADDILYCTFVFANSVPE
jgi:hypothetical protein